MRPDDRVHTDFRQQAGEHRGDGRGRGRVGVGQPGRQREHRRLDAERDQQHREQRAAGARRHAVQPDGELGHVQRAGRGVDQRDADQEDQRRHHRHHHVGDADAHPLGAGADGQQHEARRQQHLEPDEEVEQVAGQERVAHAGRQHEVGGQEDRHRLAFVAVPDALPDGVEHHGQQHDRRHHQHQRRKPVHHKRDAQRTHAGTLCPQPPTCSADRAVAVGEIEQRRAHRDHRRQRDQRDGPLQSRPAPGDQRRRRGDHRDQHGQRGQHRAAVLIATPPAPAARPARRVRRCRGMRRASAGPRRGRRLPRRSSLATRVSSGSSPTSSAVVSRYDR